MDQRFVTGVVNTPAGTIPQVRSLLTWHDHSGTVKVRCGVARMQYSVDAGLYALGQPNENDPVFVTANYKLSFDCLRRALTGRNAWILVLDTKGVNVWCAAGKGTFGTDELVRRIESSRLDQVVAHRQIVLPQLSAPGIAGLKIKKRSGFNAVFGPIRAQDLPAFMDAGLKATPEMRRKAFPLLERAVLIPVELVGAMKYALMITIAFFILGGFLGISRFWPHALNAGVFACITLGMGILGGAVMTPLLLPWLPGRAFALKGSIVGLVIGSLFWIAGFENINDRAALYESISQLILIVTVAAFLAMNFTGASTYTSLSGVRKEMKWAAPPQIAAAIIGLGLWLTSRLMI